MRQMSEEKDQQEDTKDYFRRVYRTMAALTVGFFAYIHIVDTNTLGRKISIYTGCVPAEHSRCKTEDPDSFSE